MSKPWNRLRQVYPIHGTRSRSIWKRKHLGPIRNFGISQTMVFLSPTICFSYRNGKICRISKNMLSGTLQVQQSWYFFWNAWLTSKIGKEDRSCSKCHRLLAAFPTQQNYTKRIFQNFLKKLRDSLSLISTVSLIVSNEWLLCQESQDLVLTNELCIWHLRWCAINQHAGVLKKFISIIRPDLLHLLV